MTPPKPPKKRYIQETMLRPPSPTTNNNNSFANNNNGDCPADGVPLSKSTKYAHTSPTPSSSSSQPPLPDSDSTMTGLVTLPATGANISYASPHGPNLSASHCSDGSSPHPHTTHAHTISRIMSSHSNHRSCPAPPDVGGVHSPQSGVPRRYSPTPGATSRYSPPEDALYGHQRSYSLPPTLQMAAPQKQPLSLTLSPKQSSPSSQDQQSLTSSPARRQDPMTYDDERERSQPQLDRRRSNRDDDRLVPKKSNFLKRRIIEQENQRSAQALQDQPLNLKMVAQQDQSSPGINEIPVSVTGNDRLYNRKKLYSQRRSSPVLSSPNASSRHPIASANDEYPSTLSTSSFTPPPGSPFASETPPRHPSPSVLDYTSAQATNHMQTAPAKLVSNSAARYSNASSSPDVVQITKVSVNDCVGRNSKRNNVPSPKSYSKSKQPKHSLQTSNSDQHVLSTASDRVTASIDETPSESTQESSSSPSSPHNSTKPKNDSSSLPPKKSPSSPAQASPPSTSTGSPPSTPTPNDKQQEQMLIDCIIVEGLKRNTIDSEKEERNFQLFCRSQRGAEVGVMLVSSAHAEPNSSLFAAVNTPAATTGATSCSTATAVSVTSGAATGGSGVAGPTNALYTKRTSSSPSASRDA